jgi:hypothetical protein
LRTYEKSYNLGFNSPPPCSRQEHQFAIIAKDIAIIAN